MQYGIPGKLSRNLIESLDVANSNLKSLRSMSEDFQDTSLDDLSTVPGELEMPVLPDSSAQLAQLIRQVGRVSDALNSVQQNVGKLVVHQEYTAKALIDNESRWKQEISSLHSKTHANEKRISQLERHVWMAIGALTVITFALPFIINYFIK